MSKKKKLKTSKEKNPPVKIRSAVLTMLSDPRGRGLSLQQIIKKLGFKKKDDIKHTGRIVDELEEEGTIQRLNNGAYKAERSNDAKGEEFTGIVDHVSSRFAYVKIGEDRADIYVTGKDLGSAVDGDTVKLIIFNTKHGDHQEGKVTEVIKRNRTRFVGKIEVSKNYAFVVPDYLKVHQDFFIYPENINKAKSGDKVIIEVTAWAQGDKSPEAKVVDVLGKAGENEAEIHSIMAEFDLPFRFPENVENESKSISDEISSKEIKKRRDFRDITTFTIDPEDARILTMHSLFKNWKMEIGK
jgi:ribonuclease R